MGEIMEEMIKEMRADIKQLIIDVAALKVKSKIWYSLGGAIPLAIILAIWIIKEVL